mgnify:CR=1 FL=1
MIKIENLVHKYTIWKDENTKSEKTVLDGISLDIPSGQFVAILGPNGSGKSTLAKHLNVLLLPNEGTVWIDGKDTHAKESSRFRTECCQSCIVGTLESTPESRNGISESG